ncbi:alpha/beta fold hydrolase [Streptomyces hygroscopicus]|uniref:alpha/beta fold hydrolase n=1 Tax=Streptomyces hygroscopicus TaxID=1912 RepID=UPI0036863A79
MANIITDHEGTPVQHARATVNGVRLHYYTAGQGEPVFLLHGVPKTSYYWRRVLPHLTPHYKVIVPDLRGLGDSEKPRDGYDSITMAEDIAQLADHLGHGSYDLVGEDWGAVTAYHVASQYRDKVRRLAFIDAGIPGYGLEAKSFLTKENYASRNWHWHVNFYAVRDYPEMLITGRERIYFDYFFRHEADNPQAVSQDAIEEYIRAYSAPGGIRAMCEIYRASIEDAELNYAAEKNPITIPVLAIGAEKFHGPYVEEQMKKLATNVTGLILPAGHQLAEEIPDQLAHSLLEFLQAT